MREAKLNELQRLAERPEFAVRGSHRPVVGPVVTAAKQLALRGLNPLHRSVREAQAAFNRELLRHLAGRNVLRALEPTELDTLRSLTKGTRVGLENVRHSGSSPYARAAAWLGNAALEQQFRWNGAAVDVLAAVGNAPRLDAAVARLATLTQFEGTGSRLLDRVASPFWGDALAAQHALNGQITERLEALAEALKTFTYWDYEIPVPLARLTGGGPETWDAISQYHLVQYAQYCPVLPHHSFLEVGCGVGRDAIQLTKILGPEGKYLGVDIIRPSIEWCRDNIGARHSNFRFAFFDVESQIHNEDGKLTSRDVRFEVPDSSVDRIALHSVFTHMFREDVAHYLREFRRVLKPEGLALTTWFVVDDDVLALARKTRSKFRFAHAREPGCRINDLEHPEGAVGYTMSAIEAMLRESGMRLAQPLHPGTWSGRPGENGQDVLILQRA